MRRIFFRGPLPRFYSCREGFLEGISKIFLDFGSLRNFVHDLILHPTCPFFEARGTAMDGPDLNEKLTRKPSRRVGVGFRFEDCKKCSSSCQKLE